MRVVIKNRRGSEVTSLACGLGSFSEIWYADGKRDLRKVQPASSLQREYVVGEHLFIHFCETSARLYTLLVIVKYTEPPPHN
jgi:hypothetical protein